MYNYQAPPSQFAAAPPGYAAFPGQAAPPGIAIPPGMGPPPGVALAPGMHQAQLPQTPGFPPNFQPGANMPNINFSAPVIRLGTTAPGKPDLSSSGPDRRRDGNQASDGNRRGVGLGFDNRDSQRDRMRDLPLQPPTREEVARTIFVGNITEALTDDALQRILNSAGGLRRWNRVHDADNKPCTFGFAEYEDADSLAAAKDVLGDVQITHLDHAKEDAPDDSKTTTTQLLVVIDDASQKYIEDWRGRGSMKNPEDLQFRVDSGKDELAGVLASLAAPNRSQQQFQDFNMDIDGDNTMEKANMATGDIVTIPLTVDDELSEIPTEARETVAREISAFRDRSTRRDLERLKKEEEMEQAEKMRNNASPMPSGLPSGPKDRSIQGAPLGPKGFGAQIPKDYQKGVSFVNGNGFSQEDEDTDASDEELERRRTAKKEADLEKLYLDQERRWLNRERSRTAAVEREKVRDKEEAANRDKEKAQVALLLKEWNDDQEAERKHEEYYRDRSQWLRNRASFRAREADLDASDRTLEARDRNGHVTDTARINGHADRFPDARAADLTTRAEPVREPARFKMSLGAAAQKAHAGQQSRRTVADVEGLLEDEEDGVATTAKRTLVPIDFSSLPTGAGMTDEERQRAARQLASDIPTDKDGLWAWDVAWDFVDDAVVSEQLRPFVEKKIVDYLGVQEQMLVDLVETTLKRRAKPAELVAELEGALDDEAEVLVKKLWRMLIFFSESEKRGLST